MQSHTSRGMPESTGPGAGLEAGIALLVDWSAIKYERFLADIGGCVEDWWSVDEPAHWCARRSYLTKRQSEQLVALNGEGKAALVERFTSWPGEVIRIGQAAYPEALRDLEAPPAALHVVGAVKALQRPGIAVVGSRKIGVDAASASRRLLEPAVRDGMVVVSGGALGADALAHRCAVDVGGTTICVLPSGLLNRSPKSNRRLFADIAAESGALISEYPPQRGVRKYHFARRNSLIAAMARGVLVLRAANKSGTMLTVRAAEELARPIGAVPGGPDDPLSKGCHAIVRQGGRMIASARDLRAWWQELAPTETEFRHAKTAADNKREQRSTPTALPDCAVLASAVQHLDRRGTFSLEVVARQCDVSAAEIQTVMLGHELSGIVERVAGGDRFRLLIGDHC